ncbi:MAG: Na/Pi cotransporter family protein [Spirochaetales bacterium]|nr:Na/Pi cotransporter family protein [Spirochaetales bacterium]
MVAGLLEIVGSLGLFLFGMKTMSDGIQKSAGERLQGILNFMTRNRFVAVLTGFFLTAVIQSSSASTVMIVSFVNAGLLSLSQAIGAIMGANIGTTVTAWIVSFFGFKFKIIALALPAIGIGMPLIIAKKWGKQDLGEVLVGFGLLFIGLDFLKDSVPDIKNNPEVLQFLADYTNLGFLSFLIFVIVGAALTVVVQSSSAAMTITITMAYSGWIDFPTAAAIVLGENIGTTVTAFLASIGTDINARRAARAHTLFNVIGVIWMAFLFRFFLNFIDAIVPGSPYGPEGAHNIPLHLSLFHTMFNITNTFVFIWFIPQIAKLVEILVPRKEEDSMKGRYTLKYLSSSIQDTPELNLIKAKVEISKMAKVAEEMYNKFLEIFCEKPKHMNQMVLTAHEMEDMTDQMQEEISAYLSKCSQENLTVRSQQNIPPMIRIVHELESIADSIYNLMRISDVRVRKGLEFHPEGTEDLKPYLEKVRKFLTFIQAHLNEHLSSNEMIEALQLEDEINKTLKDLIKSSRKRLRNGEDVRTELLYLDMVKELEQIGDFSLNVAEALRTIH